MRKRIASIVLSVCLSLSLLPTAAFAEGTSEPATTTNKTLVLGTSGIKSPTQVDAGKNNDNGNQQYHYTPNSYIYFGMNDTTPIKWRVLDADKANDGSATGMFLLSEYLLADNLQFIISHLYKNNGTNEYHKGEEPADENHACVTVGDANYQGSNVQTWCNTFTTNSSNFSAAEQGVMLGVAKMDNAEPNNLFSVSWCESELTADDKLFFLSARELADYVGNYDNAPGLLAMDATTQSVGAWWLRSPVSPTSTQDTVKRASAVVIQSNGNVKATGSPVTYYRAARPAFNLTLDSVLFTSAAVDGKSGTLGELSEIGTYEGSEWKLTLKDDNHKNFSVTTTLSTVEIGDTVSLDYSGAVTGDNEYISVIIEDSDNNLIRYGRMAKVDATDGEVNIPIPSDLERGTYTLKVFNEQYNGNYKTDYASDFQTVTFTAVDTTAPKLTAGTASRTSDTNAAVTFTSSEAGTYYYAVVDSGATAPTIDTSGEGTACDTTAQTISLTDLTTAGAKDIYIVAKDAAGNVSDTLTITIPAYVAPSGGSSAPTYSVTAPKADNGTVKVSPRYAEQGDTVTVTITPDEGYLLDSLTVTDKNGNTLELKDLGNGKYSFKMPKGKVNVEAAFVEDTEPLPSFVDVPANAYYYDAVEWAAKNGVTGGVDENHFAPNEPCSRAQLVTFLWRAAGQPEASGTSGMTDVSQTAYYADAVAWAFENGIVGGYGNGLFGSDDTITREQMAVILYRFAQATGMDTTQGGMSVREYKDYDSISDYAVTAIQWAVNAGVMQGNGGNLMPGQPCTRAQIVTMLYRLLDK